MDMDIDMHLDVGMNKNKDIEIEKGTGIGIGVDILLYFSPSRLSGRFQWVNLCLDHSEVQKTDV